MGISQLEISLRDPEHSNSIMGASVWWKWVSNPHTPRENLWQAKYARNWSKEDLIRFNIDPGGSQIWKVANNQIQMIETHIFWELCSGT